MEHIVRITAPPVLSGRQSTPDGAICGNGDLGIILGSFSGGLRVYLSKCDLWQAIERSDTGGIRPLGCIDFSMPDDVYADYYAEQDMDKGELRCRFGRGEKTCLITLRPCKTENMLLIETGGSIKTAPVLKVTDAGTAAGHYGEINEGGICGIFRSFEGDDHIFETHCFAFIKAAAEGRYCLFAATNHDCADPKAVALEKVRAADMAVFDALTAEHYRAWERFRAKSAFTCDDAALENGWYASQYFLACCTGNAKFPPGIFGNFITVESPSWHGDYHLNYNYQAPFYAACSSNHVEFTDCYHAPLEDFVEKGREFASKFGCRGIILPVGIMPGGICSELTPSNKYWFDRLFLGQKSNGIHPADIMVFRWRATRDKEYARLHAYPYIKECLEFFEDWLTEENGRLSVTKDAVHEVPYYKEDFEPKKYAYYINGKNNPLTLGLLRLCIPAAVEMAQALGVDEDKQKKWNDILNRLSPFPTYYRHFKKVYRYTEKGQRWHGDNDVGVQHIYPCGCVGRLKSSPAELRVALNTFRQREKFCYIDDNAVCSFFPMAARLGRDPDMIIQKLHELNEKKMLPNMLFNFAGGCLENCSVFANTLNEMVMQSFEGIIRIFPCWGRGRDASFKTLRADGAFLVSSSLKNGKIEFVRIQSEAGSELKLENPYKKAKVSVNGKTRISAESIITEKTAPGDEITVTDAENE